MSKAVKTIIGVVAAIAIPFAAPAIASSIGLSAAIGGAVGSATAGSVIGGALTGAALGAAKGVILGEDVGRSALMGGLSGGVGGYTAAPSAPAGGAVGATAPTAAAPTMTAAGAPKTFTEALSKAGDAIKAKFMDPKNLADMTLRAAGNLAGSALAGSGLSDEEQALLNAQTEELRMLQQTNQALFNQRLEYAQNLIGESRYFDPEYFGMRRARRTQLAGAKAKQAGLRGLTGDRRAAESRRFDLATSRDVGTAYDVGFSSAIAPRLQTMQAGLSAMPTGYPSSMADYRNLQATYGDAYRRTRETQGDIGELFGSLTGGTKARSLG